MRGVHPEVGRRLAACALGCGLATEAPILATWGWGAASTRTPLLRPDLGGGVPPLGAHELGELSLKQEPWVAGVSLKGRQ